MSLPRQIRSKAPERMGNKTERSVTDPAEKGFRHQPPWHRDMVLRGLNSPKVMLGGAFGNCRSYRLSSTHSGPGPVPHALYI